MNPSPPHYDDAGCDHVRAAAMLWTRYAVTHMEQLAPGRAVEVDHGTRQIKVKIGMSHSRYQLGVLRAALYILDPSWAPEFQTGSSKLSLVASEPENPDQRELSRYA